ncbi:cytochrome P450 [Paractinoplanes rishiriensis]|uniref:Cytochrome P450 n=1 Tax=Paractinoplanes rishiriensis TaxID=1050105 RepID=A0A919JQC9_9ACTN|nr:cytochrome P450 [Actinoplanes rishiriensis]GIE92803.1 cytochrome P450 [Actinoplanes rishiriensis]
MSGAARRLDRRVYLGSHPVLFAVLAATRGRAVRRIGGTLLVHGRDAYTEALTRIPLDRTAPGTTGGAAGELAGPGALFDQQGDEHRRTRRDTAARLGAAGVESLRPIWTTVVDRQVAALVDGRPVDLVPLAAEMAGRTAAALLDLDVDPIRLATAAREAGAAAARAHLPGPGRRRYQRHAAAATARLVDLVAPGGAGRGLAVMLTIAAVNTTVAALPRAAAWMCRDGLWAYGKDPGLVDELLRVTAPTPLLPRVAAGPGDLGGCPVRAGDRMMLIARHAADAHRAAPNPECPAPAQVANLVFGAGPHFCPGARLARAQLGDLLAALAPHRPAVLRARVDRRSALPGWRELVVAAR